MIKSIRIQNFKSVIDSGKIELKNINAFIGNNGTGKSSIIEAIQLLQDLVITYNFNDVFKKWGGLEKVRNKYSDIESLNVKQNTKEKLRKNKFGIERSNLPISIQLEAKINKSLFDYEIQINTSLDGKAALNPEIMELK